MVARKAFGLEKNKTNTTRTLYVSLDRADAVIDGYDPDLLGRDEVDEKALLGLRGVVRVSHTTLNGRSFLNLEGFAPGGEWEELSVATVRTGESSEAGDDL